MRDYRLSAPVAFMVFNRPDTTRSVFEEIRKARPPKLFVIADGPRENHPGDAENCSKVRSIIDSVDWPCEVVKNYSDLNLGCGLRPATGISWVFEQVEEAIILEDDCLPHPTFFRFCEELLTKYRNDTRIMHIAGNNSQIMSKRGNYSYYFSLFPHCWGWASWRRAWRYFDFHLKLLPKVLRYGWLADLLQSEKAAEYWTQRCKEVYVSNKTHIWDYQWTFACWIQGGLSILPNNTLISNIGFSENATHTKAYNKFANLPVSAMEFPLRHPEFMIRDSEADDRAQSHIFTPDTALRTRETFLRFLRGVFSWK